MRPDNMPRPFAPEDDDIELLRPSNVELLRILRDEDETLSDWEVEALTAAINALEAVSNAESIECDGCNGIGTIHGTPCGLCEGSGKLKVIPADALGEQP